jgi:hypothetical protein
VPNADIRLAREPFLVLLRKPDHRAAQHPSFASTGRISLKTQPARAIAASGMTGFDAAFISGNVD